MKKLFARYKIYFDRARMYVSYAQTAAVVLTTLKVFDIIPPWWAIVPLVLVFTILCLFVGWLDMRLGVYSEENRRMTEQNPVIMEILELIKNGQKK
jgi:hypothetical protein